MTTGASLVLIAAGAILKFAVTATVSGIDLGTIGVVFMIVGVIGLIIGLMLTLRRRRTDVVQSSDLASGVVRRTTLTQDEPRDPQY